MRRIVGYASLIGLAIGLVSSLLVSLPAAATSTQLDVQVCGPGAVSQLKLTAPPSDTVFRQSPIMLSGEVELINQVEVYIDELYSKVVAVPRGQSQFASLVELKRGTQTIEVRGVGVCSGQELAASVVVTYEPPASPEAPNQPSPGANVPTVINPSPTPSGGGVVVGNPNLPPVSPAPDSSGDGSLWWRSWQAALGWLGGNEFSRWLIRFSDADVTAGRLPGNWLRLLATVLGLAALVAASLRRFLRQRWYLLAAGFMLLAGSLLLFL